MNYTKKYNYNDIRYGIKKKYLIGFILSIILTVIPFLMVMYSTISHYNILCIVISTAIIQIMVHFICFFHMNTSFNDNWNFIAFLFTILIIGIIIIGSLWIMNNLNINMMLN
ncbi:MAG: cytochrome o ubiquinol oxidase subunit IV [Arsenophonus sp. ER-QC15-MAG3]